ncbi:MAG: antirestriction protein ArdA [Candidatus Bathyarchaeota archaeon]|nr:antirestriction protein ArdA [Candidatus Termiticorpusculum sp.]
MCEQTFTQQQTNPQLKVYVANLSKYVEGELCGDWLNLPTTHNQIKTFLKDKVKLNARYEEYALHDYESEFRIGEYENIYDLNILAVKLETMSETEKTIAAAYCNANGLKDTTSILNICTQIDELLYVELDADNWGSREEKLGYAMVDNINSEIKETLEQCKLGTGLSAYCYFDFEAYGRDTAINEGYFATDDIFIFSTSKDLNPKLHTTQEIKNTLNDPRLEET